MSRRFVNGQISHETIAFSPIRTELHLFGERGLSEGQDVLRTHAGTRTGIGGFMDFCREAGAELIPIISASATPSGLVASEAYAVLKDKLLSGIRSAGKIDGVLLCMHGATFRMLRIRHTAERCLVR